MIRQNASGKIKDVRIRENFDLIKVVIVKRWVHRQRESQKPFCSVDDSNHRDEKAKNKCIVFKTSIMKTSNVKD